MVRVGDPRRVGEAERTAWAQPALLTVSFLLLTLELAQIRLFSYSLFPTVVYVAIAITLLGLGASGTVLAMSPRLRAADSRRLTAAACLGFAAAVPLAHLAFAHLVEPRKVAGLGEYPALTALLAGLTVPHFLLGLAIARLLSGPAEAIDAAAARGGVHRLYFANLLGSSLGCLAFNPVLPRLGLERLIMAVALGGAAAGIACAAGALRRAGIALAVLLAAGMVTAPRLVDFPPRFGQLEDLLTVLAQHRLEARREFSVWDPVGRIEIHSLGDDRVFLPAPVQSRFYSQDASNGSILIAFPPDSAGGAAFFEGTVYGAAYFGGRPDSVLVIGLGGGPDIFTALHFGARSVTGVEINRAAIEAIAGPMAGFLGDPYHRPGVTIVCADGRGFLRRTTNKYDVVQLSGVDTGTALAPGSNVLAENYLYTREAIRDMLGALTPEGVLSILRFAKDALRLALIASDVLREAGSTEPGRHLVVVGQGFWQNLLIKRTPFTPDELQNLDRHLRRGGDLPRVRIPTYEYLGFGLEQPLAYIYHPLAPVRSYMAEFWALAREGREAEIFRRGPALLRSVTDDRPFYFFNFFGELRPLVLFLAEIAAVAALFIFLPLLRLGRSGVPLGRSGATLLYFFALGAGYLVVEVVLMQRFVLFLGHPAYAISVTLFALLLWSSLGARAAGWTMARRAPASLAAIRLPLLGIAALAVLAAFDVHAPVLSAARGFALPARAAVVIALVAPLGFLMGMPFPGGLSLLGRRPELVPWAIGVNGFASVVAAVGNIPLAMMWGFRAVLLIGAGLYLAAWLATRAGALAVGDRGDDRR